MEEIKQVRIEFGVERSECGCRTCRRNCRFMPGFLIPADLERMIPEGMNPFLWAESNLLASPGALVIAKGQTFRIPTLVPKTKPDGSCIHFNKRKCDIHQIAPFGCAFFDCGQERRGSHNRLLSHLGLTAVDEVWQAGSGLYVSIHRHLWAKGLIQKSPDELRARMNE